MSSRQSFFNEIDSSSILVNRGTPFMWQLHSYILILGGSHFCKKLKGMFFFLFYRNRKSVRSFSAWCYMIHYWNTRPFLISFKVVCQFWALKKSWKKLLLSFSIFCSQQWWSITSLRQVITKTSCYSWRTSEKCNADALFIHTEFISWWSAWFFIFYHWFKIQYYHFCAWFNCSVSQKQRGHFCFNMLIIIYHWRGNYDQKTVSHQPIIIALPLQ